MATDLHTLRRLGIQALFQEFAEEQIAAGVPPKGLDSAFAERLQIGVATWSMAKSGKRPIGDKLARQIEHNAGRPIGWLDEPRQPQGISGAEQQFLSMALKAWRETNSEGRKSLKETIRNWSSRATPR